MAMMRVDFQMESSDTPRVNSDIRKRFLSVADVASWKLVNEKGEVVYTGLVVNGPKPLPNGGFQFIADFTLDMPADPTKGIPTDAIPAIQNAVMTEFQKRAVIKTYSPPSTVQ
jgi:hypothetical protein